MSLRSEHILKIMKHFLEKGFYVNDGIKYGVDLLLYTDHPEKVHSKYAILYNDNYTFFNILGIQRVCSSVNKILLIVEIKDDVVNTVMVNRHLMSSKTFN